MGNESAPNGSPSIGRMVSFGVLLGVIVVIGALFFRVMASFLLPLFLAALLAVVFGPLHKWLSRRMPKSPTLAAGCATVALFLLILAPLSLALSLAVRQGIDLAYSDRTDLTTKLADFRARFGLQLPMHRELDQLRGQLAHLHFLPDATLPDPAELTARIEGVTSAIGKVEEGLGQAADPVTIASVKPERLEGVRRELNSLRDTVKEATGLVTTGVHDKELWDFEAQDIARQSFERAIIRGAKFREALLGGAPRSWLVELANPDDAHFTSWRQSAGRTLQNWLLSLTGQTTALLANVAFGLGITMISLFYFFLDGPRMILAIMRLSPLDDRYELELATEFANVSRAVVLATLVSAIAQGVLAGIGFYFAGFEPLFLLIILTAVLSLVPFVGAGAVWVPACLWLGIMDQRWLAAVVLAVYCIGIVSMADNIIKPYILQGQSNIHPLLGLLSVLGGVQAMGPIGIFIGPMLVAFLQALLIILQKEMKSLEEKA